MTENSDLTNGNVPLSSLGVGESGIIVRLNFKGVIRQRLMAMGLVRGETITVERVAPLGDPLEYLVKGYHLSLRRSEASQIIVTRTGANGN